MESPGAVERWPGLHRTHSLAEKLRAEGLLAAHFDLLMHEGRVWVDAMTEQEPRAANRVAPLYEGTGPACGLRVHFALSKLDQRTIDSALGVHRELASKFGGPDASDVTPERSWFHPAGTCRMSADPLQGVVNRDGLVFGTQNLFAVGAATFPTSGSGNPTLTVVALAMRLGDHIAGRLA